MKEVISHVSDTARWVAVYRAMETERADALFRDPYARRLAGATGERIVGALPSGRAQAWAMIVRTKVFDEIIMRLVSAGEVDAVLNLAAGLDTRPYRLPLPPKLRWLDVDFPDMVDYKRSQLEGETPACDYDAVGIDLADVSARGAMFDRIDRAAKKVAVISEGLLIYLTRDQVSSLARDLASRPRFPYWLIDIASPLLLKFMNRSWGRKLSAQGAQFLFAPQEGPKFFEPFGWRVGEYHSNWEEARRLKRRMSFAWVWDLVARFSSASRREQYRTMAGTILLERAAPTH